VNRRHFLVQTGVLGTVGGLMPHWVHARTQSSNTLVAANSAAATPSVSTDAPSRHFVMTQDYQLQAPTGSTGPMRLWVPLPFNDAPYQVLRGLQWSGDFQTAQLAADPEFGAQVLYLEWDDCQGPMNATVEMALDTQDWLLGRQQVLDTYQPPATLNYPPEVARFLQGSRHIKIDGLVKETADRIVGDETNPLRQARLIHDWVAENMERDNSVIGCGVGDVGEIIESGKLYGKCTDINSVFVALARAVGIPAREVFGLRVGGPRHLAQYSKTAFGSADEQGRAQNTDWQHCRAQFWLHGIGWVPCDPADVTKMRLAEDKPHQDSAVQAVNDDLFGNWEMNWVGFNFGRDFVLEPLPEQRPINNFGYPYAEAGGDPLDYYDFANFRYDYRAVETSGNESDQA